MESDSIGIDDEEIAELRRSKAIVGELRPVLVDSRTGRMIDGRHRKLAGWGSTKMITTADDLDYYTKRLHATHQRRSSQAELADLFGHICEELEKQGMEPSTIASKVVQLSAYSVDYTYSLIANKYKRSGGYDTGRINEPELGEASAKVETLPGEARVRPRVDGPILMNCPRCHAPLKIEAGQLTLV